MFGFTFKDCPLPRCHNRFSKLLSLQRHEEIACHFSIVPFLICLLRNTGCAAVCARNQCFQPVFVLELMEQDSNSSSSSKSIESKDSD